MKPQPTSVDSSLASRVEQQRVALLFANMRGISESAVLMAVLAVLVAFNTAPPLALVIWSCLVLVDQAAIQWLAFAFRNAADARSNARGWGQYYAALAAISGTVWGAGIFALTTQDSPRVQALVAACLAGRATVTLMTHAYFPPSLYAFAIPLFSLVSLRYALAGGLANVVLGIMWMAVLGYLLLFGHRQGRTAVSSIELQFNNEKLLEELKRKNATEAQARREAEEASRSKSRFFAAANHDLRQPLHSLGLFAAALRNQPMEPQQQKLVDQILQCNESLEQLFDNLLDLSRLDAGQVDTKLERVSAATLLERLRGTHAAAARAKGLRLRVRPSSLVFTSDPTLLFRVLSNFVSNALRYTKSGGVLVACRRRGKVASFEVWDTGIGIPANQKERIFEEFYQLHNPERDRSRGLGLGLATVKRIAHLLGYEVRVRSVLKRGSMFAIDVPLPPHGAVSQPAESTIEQKMPNLLKGKHILVIDDEASVRMGMQSLLESWGCHCVAVTDHHMALEKLAGKAPDFILADLRLAGNLNGIDAIRALRAQLGEGIPAVLVSGDTASEQLRRVSQAGLTMMPKPLKAVRLRALLNHEFARGPALRRAVEKLTR